MSQKNEAPILILSLLITIALIAGGMWWFSNRFGGISTNTTATSNSANNIPNQETNTPVSNTSNGANFATVQNIPTGLFNYGGSTSWAPIRLSVDSKLQQERPEFRLRYVEPNNNTPGSSTGIQALIDGQLTFAQSSRPILDTEIQRAKTRGFDIKQITVAIDGLAVAVNPNLNISGLTIDQLKSIYTGKVTNWKELGGTSIPIKAYSRRVEDGGTVELFVQDILGRQKFAPNVEFVPTTTQALQKISTNPGGIYFASAPEVVPQCSIKPVPLGRKQGSYVAPYTEPFILPVECPGKRNKLNIEAFQSGKYPITRNLFVVVKQNGQIEQQVGEAYANLLLTEQGQELISQAGFVKIR
jgi:phosphate transport system substrate-binding protein